MALAPDPCDTNACGCNRVCGCASVPDVAASYPIPRQSSVPCVSSVPVPIPTVSVEPPLAFGICGGVEVAWHAASGCVPLQVPNLSGLLVLVSS